jgi:hypothetical protein
MIETLAKKARNPAIKVEYLAADEVTFPGDIDTISLNN